MGPFANSGTGDLTRTTRDRVYLSTDDRLDLSDRILTTVDSSGKLPLKAGTNYIQASSITLPLDNGTPAGTYYLIVAADVNNDQFRIE